MLEQRGSTEYLIVAVARNSGRPYPPFLVPAQDEKAARRLAQRRYLVIQSVALYTHREGEAKPKVYPLGPPISDQSFEQDYYNRPPDPDSRGGVSGEQGVEGGILLFRILLRFLSLFGG
jgi:hypothetical protein